MSVLFYFNTFLFHIFLCSNYCGLNIVQLILYCVMYLLLLCVIGEVLWQVIPSIIFPNMFMFRIKRVIVSYILGTTDLSIGEGNGTPLQYSCLENPMDRGAC